MTQKDYIALVNQAQRKSYEYYVLSAPTISDTEFDVLVAEIEKAEKFHKRIRYFSGEEALNA